LYRTANDISDSLQLLDEVEERVIKRVLAATTKDDGLVRKFTVGEEVHILMCLMFPFYRACFRSLFGGASVGGVTALVGRHIKLWFRVSIRRREWYAVLFRMCFSCYFVHLFQFFVLQIDYKYDTGEIGTSLASDERISRLGKKK